MRTSRIVLALCIVLGCGGPVALASDSDLQQYNGSANWQSDLTAASTLLPRDGKKISADNNASGAAPVNRSLKQLKDYLIGLHDGVVGSRSGSQLRTVRAVETDGSGGAAATVTNGDVKASRALRAGRSLFATTVPTGDVDAGEYVKEASPRCMAHLTSNGSGVTIMAAVGVDSITRVSTGVYRVVCRGVPSGPTATNSLVTTGALATTTVGYVTTLEAVTNRLQVELQAKDLAGSAIDTAVSVVAYIF